MKKKISIIALLLAFITIGLTSCNTGGDDRLWMADTGTLIYLGMGTDLCVKLDAEGDILLPNALPNISGHTWESGDRVFIQFYIDQEMEDESNYQYKGEIILLELIQTFNPFKIISEIADTLDVDPFYEIDGHSEKTMMWISGNYLTVLPILSYLDYRKHSVTLSYHNPEEISSGTDTIHLELNHNAYGDQGQINYGPYYCFRLNEFKSPIGKDTAVLSIKMPVIQYPGTDKKYDKRNIKYYRK
ncbi:MAG: hypothetical protein LBL90_08685 [Prevotellaceae bacterium]|jgi:hypothetical protein|nr:hypothetical protein [Prevotellaceae bacterium]